MGIAGLAVLLAVAGVAVARSGSEPPEARQGWTEYPSPSPVQIDEGPVFEPVPDPFAEFSRATAPPTGSVAGVLLAHGEPGFLVATEGTLTALTAFGGPDHARVLVGWCAGSRTFQDATGTYVYDQFGFGLTEGAMLRHEVRQNGRVVEIAGEGTPAASGPHPPEPQRRATCRDELRWPRLPERADDVHATIGGFRVVRGRYVVTTESASFCAPVGPGGCAAQGWEDYELGTLPGSDLAGSYTWEGDFVVRGDRDGHLTAVRMAEARLVARTEVGRSAVLGAIREVTGEDPLTLRVGSLARNDGETVRATYGHRTIVVGAGAPVHLGRGYTGLGRPVGTAATLRDYLAENATGPHRFWFVLDARGQVIRVVID